MEEDNIEDIDRGDSVEDLEEESLDQEESEDLEEESPDQEESEDLEESEDIKIPKSRLDEVIAQRESEKERSKWLEAQLEKLLTKEEKPEEEVESYDFIAAEKKYAELLIEGDTSEAAQLRSDIDNERRKEMVNLVNKVKDSSIEEAKNSSQETLEEDRFNTLIDSFENKYSFLNGDSTEYNEEAVETVNMLMQGYVNSGKTKSQALNLAVKKVVPMYVPNETKLGGRRTKALKKSAAASKQQPPKTSSKNITSENAESVSIQGMSEKEFDSLTLKEKRLLRGD